MIAINPESFKQVKDIALPAIAFAIARVPDSDVAYFGCSDFKVYKADLWGITYAVKRVRMSRTMTRNWKNAAISPAAA